MRSKTCFLARASVVFSACLFVNCAWATAPTAPVEESLARLEKWLGNGSNGKLWGTYLNLPGLKVELAKQEGADAAILSEVLKQLESKAAGLELGPFRALRDALVEWADELTARKPLTDAVAGAQNNFRAVAADEILADKKTLEAAIAKLGRFLDTSGANGKAWKAYLGWAELENQAKSSSPNPEALRKANEPLSADQPGLELPVFSNVRDALDRYAQGLDARREDLRAQFVAQLTALADQLKQYIETYNDESAIALGSRLGWLENVRQVPKLVRAVRRKHSHPNLHVEVSARLVAAGIAQGVDETGPITDEILGTSISGTARTVGRVGVQLVPSADKAILETSLTGTTLTNTVGFNGPATIYSQGTTKILGTKRLVIDEFGLSSHPAKATASTSTRIDGVGARSRFIQKIASKKVYQKKSQAEQIGSDHAAARVRARVETQAARQVGQTQAGYLEKFRNPLVRRREFPGLLKFSTSAETMFVTALQANRNQVGAPDAAPNATSGNDLSVRLHESMINNIAAAMLAGLTLKEEELQKKVIEWRGSLPKQLESDEDRDPWSITFANIRPVTVKFADDGFRVTVRGQRYTSGERAFRAMDVTADYKMKISGNGSILERQGELQIFPPNFVAGQTSLSTQQVTLKTLLKRKFGKLFEPEIKNEGLVLPGRWQQAGRLDLKQLQASGGWLVLAWIQSGEPAPSADKVARETPSGAGLAR